MKESFDDVRKTFLSIWATSNTLLHAILDTIEYYCLPLFLDKQNRNQHTHEKDTNPSAYLLRICCLWSKPMEKQIRANGQYATYPKPI